MAFELTAKDNKSNARKGLFETDHGQFETPAFMPVGTAGAVKAVHMRELIRDIEAEIILGNTYHLYLRPGLDVIKNAGGLHQFISWDKPLLTDSGGYQVYSLAKIRKIEEEGVKFQSHIDGSSHLFTPENVIDTQRIIGADIIMAFDECTPYPCDYEYAEKSMELTHRWLDRCVDHFNKTEGLYDHNQYLFPIVQGSVYKDLRKISAETIASKDMAGNAIGGLSVGEDHDEMYQMTDLVCDLLPEDKPRYLMGVGTPENLLECIALGIDMFDCVIPTRNGRNGMLFTSEGIINIKNEKWKDDFSYIDENIGGYVSKTYTKAYLRHLIQSNEILGAQIASLHNLRFYHWLMEESRKKIKEGTFGTWKDTIITKVAVKL